MKRLLIVLFSFPLFVSAQNKPLVIEGVSPNLYVKHTVASKENYYSIGRIYNISPKEVAPFNNLVLESGLSLGQELKIPLSAANFVQTGDAGPDEVLVPVYHVVEGKESLYRIGVNYNKLPVETLKRWNNLKGDAVANGTNLIVGYLKVKKDLSSLANMAKTKPADNTAQAVETQNKTVAVKKPEETKATTPPAKEPVKEKAPVTETAKKEPETGVTVKENEAAKKVTTPVAG
jgi:LysM repeat protein